MDLYGWLKGVPSGEMGRGRRQGQGLVEYALILVLIAVVIIVILTLLGTRANMVFARVVVQMQHPGNYSGPSLALTEGDVNLTVSSGGRKGSVSVGAAGGNTVCATFSQSGGGSQIACGTAPSANFPSSGKITACVIAVENRSLAQPMCKTQ